MSGEVDVRAEGGLSTGHVLFLDLVASSVLPVGDQMRLVGELLGRIRATGSYIHAVADGSMIPVPSGDGVALVFFGDPGKPAECAKEIVALLGDLAVRMGIHSGAVGVVDDIRGGSTVVGEGINGAKRVMDCAGAGEVLVSDDWAAGCAGAIDSLIDRGVVSAKHGRLIHVWELPTGNTGFRKRGTTLPPVQSGALPVESNRYVERPVDVEVRNALSRRDSIVLVKGGRQMGKSSLLARALSHVRGQGTSVAVLDLLAVADDDFADCRRFLRRMAESVEDQVTASTPVEQVWDEHRAAGANLERWLRRHVLPSAPFGLVLAIDQADRLLRHSWCGEVFGLFRAWHNRRATDPESDWARLSIALAYTAEAHHFIADPNQSPFNVGTPSVLSDLTLDEAQQLRARIVPDLGAAEWEGFVAWVGGHPYLVQLGIDAVSSGGWDLSGLMAATRAQEGPLMPHLQGLLRWVEANPEHHSWLADLAERRGPLGVAAFMGLRSIGLVGSDHRSTATWRSPLYREWWETRVR